MKLVEALKIGWWAWKSSGPHVRSAGDWLDNLFRVAADTLPIPTRITRPFEQHPVVYRVMTAFARNMARVPYEIFRSGSDEPIEDHPVIKLLSNPNPSLRGTQLIETTALHLEHWGRSFWHFGEPARANNSTRLPSSIVLLPPSATKTKLGRDGAPEVYEVKTKEGQTLTIPPEQVMRFRYASPYADDEGSTWLEPARAEYETDFMAQRWNRGFFQRGAEPGGILMPQDDYETLDEDVDRLRRQWMEKHQGFQKAHMPAVMPRGLKYEKTGIGQKEMDFVGLRKNSRENTLVAGGLPPALASVLEFANYANMQPQLRIFFELELLPRLKYIESVLQADLLDAFKLGVEGRFKVEVINALLEDLDVKANVATKLWNIGVPLTHLNDRLELGFDLDGVPGADEPHLPFTSTPVSPDLPETEGESERPAVDDEDEEDEEERALRGEETRAKFWRGLINLTSDLVSKAESRYRDHLRNLRDEVLAKIRGAAASGPAGNGRSAKEIVSAERMLFDLRQADEEIVISFEPIYRGTLLRAADALAKETGLVVDLDFLDPQVLEILAQRKIGIKGANRRMQGELRERLGELLQESASEEAMEDAVRVYFSGQRSNARAIARTEVHGSFSAGRFESMRQVGIERQEWLSARDSRVRDDHRAEDGNIVSIGDRFPVTKLLYPLDPTGPAGQVVNCRCVPLAVI